MIRNFLLLFILTAVASADTADDIARIHTEAIGGRKRMNQLTTLQASGRVAIDGRELTFRLIAARPNRLRMESMSGGRRIIQATDGVTPPWQQLPDANPPVVTELKGEEAREFAADAEFDDPLIDHAARGYALDYAGETTIDGRRLLKLLVTRRLVDSYLLFVDAETYFIVRKEGTRIRNGTEVKVVTTYGDFRPVGGVILPHRFVASTEERVLHETVLESVTPNVPVPPGSFERPIVITVPEMK